MQRAAQLVVARGEAPLQPCYGGGQEALLLLQAPHATVVHGLPQTVPRGVQVAGQSECTDGRHAVVRHMRREAGEDGDPSKKKHTTRLIRFYRCGGGACQDTRAVGSVRVCAPAV